MVTVQIFKTTDLFLSKFSSQENTKLHKNLQCRLTVDIFYISIELKKELGITEFFIFLQEMQSFADLCRILQKNVDNFFFRKCSMMLIER